MEMATRSSASSGGEDGDSVGGDEDLMAVYHVLLAFFFIGCLFAFGKLFSLLHGKLIGEIICGFLLGGLLLFFLFLIFFFSFFFFLFFFLFFFYSFFPKKKHFKPKVESIPQQQEFSTLYQNKKVGNLLVKWV